MNWKAKVANTEPNKVVFGYVLVEKNLPKIQCSTVITSFVGKNER